MNVDEIVERVREAIRTGTVDGRRLEGCAFGPCSSSVTRGGAGCHMCDVIAKLEQPGERAARLAAAADAAAVDVDVHEREHKNPARDGDPKLSGAKQRRHPMYEKRRRQGPHRGNA